MNASRAFRTLRWLLTVPAGIAGWYLGVMLAMGIAVLTDSLQPHLAPGPVLHDPAWHALSQHVAIGAGALLCGALAVALPAWVAPAHRDRIALLAYAIGLACSAYWLIHLLWQPVAWAALSGAVVCWRLQGFGFARRVLRRHA